MQIKVNEKPVEIFAGARVRDVLRKYSKVTWTQVQRGSKKACDGHGHEIGLDGELADGARIVITRARRAGSRT